MTGEEFAALLDKRDELRNRCDRGRSSHVVVPRETYTELIDTEVEIAKEIERERSRP